MSKGATAAWMKFYVSDWIGGVRGLSLAAKGAYIDLLCLAWEKGSLPDDHAFLARYLGVPMDEFQAVWKELEGNWTSVGGVLTNPKQEDVRAGQEEVHRQRVEAGRRSAAAKKARAAEQTPNVSTNVRTDERANVRTNGEREDSGLRAQVSRTEEQQASGARPRDAAAEPPSGETPDWTARAIASIRAQGIPVNPGDRNLKGLLASERWEVPGLSEGDRLRGLAVVVNRAKRADNPRGLLETILKDEGEGAVQALASVPAAQVSNTTTGEGSRHWDSSPEAKALLHREHAEKCRASGQLDEAAQHVLAAEKLEAVA